ncbi:MAG: MBL fold metallo-hydrolase [Bacteroidetes bacterium]|nr:MBL fold metallo-hydrolase [Bacteroidota bacterium]MBU1373047.1 MBL fold metallo-hydrolase [Bacteroidota bacterium]MBU1483696.1 MBL fold metallo-hydrolase [Bacteroidota bacterium]MBU1759498.1 MBL fold metallo-hydrolase [Bacteroidota bacterium]MBU2267067.1 MBL fold metallo-hydrolase [Bacteroidota bacterium]
MKIHKIETGFFKLDGGAMFGVVPKVIWNKTNPADENNLCTWAMRCLLIEDDNRLILVDTGIGHKQDEKFLSHYYLHGSDSLDQSITNAGFSKDDITDVFLTHLHFDHCGGAIIKEDGILKPAFKNATYWSNQKHWDWAINPNQREKASFLKENILPIQQSGQLKLIPNEDGFQFSTNIKVRFAYGHTEAMMLPQLNFNGQTLVYMADLLPSVGHIPLPFVMSYDMFPMKTLVEKAAFLKEAEEKNYILILEHDSVNECCTLHMTEKGIRLYETFKLSDIY